jgi:hypothetical protein
MVYPVSRLSIITYTNLDPNLNIHIFANIGTYGSLSTP